MIAIDDVQLTPKRVPVGGNFLLRVLARYIADGGDDVTITTQDIQLTWHLYEQMQIMYADLDLDSSGYARLIGAHTTFVAGAQSAAVLKVPGAFSFNSIPPIQLQFGQLYNSGGYCVIADMRDTYELSSTMPQAYLELFQGMFTVLRLYFLGEE